MAIKKETKKQENQTNTAESKSEGSKLSIQDKRAALQKILGKEAIYSSETVKHIEKTPTGLLGLDALLGGGLPRGRIIEVYGPESSGKTSLTFLAASFFQKLKEDVAFIDVEQAIDSDYARQVGFDIDKAILSQPDSAEQALNLADEINRSGYVGLGILDSVAALTPQKELDGDMGDSHMGLQARLMSQALRKMTGHINKTNTTFFFINQLRMKIGVMFGSPETTTGGNALKFYASVRMDVRRIGSIKVGDVIVGNRIRVKLVKNKTGKPFVEREFNIMFGKGYDKFSDLFELALENKVIQSGGAWFTFGDVKVQGKDSMRKAILSDLTLARSVFDKTVDALIEKGDLNERYKQHADLVFQSMELDKYTNVETSAASDAA